MNIGYTITPPQQPTQEEWMKEFKVGSQAPRFDDRAADMNSQYNFTSQGFAAVVAKLLLPS